MYLIFFIVSFLASLAGAICGIGGGVLIKPILDVTGVMSVSAISFLSGCTVLSMSAVSVGSNFRTGKNLVKVKEILPLAVGAAAGGLVGKVIFQNIKSHAASEDRVGMIQAIVLLVITVFTLIYTLEKKKIKTLQLQNFGISVCVGVSLGFFSSFLGIGGGPINLMVLNFFFSMDTKEAASNSLFVILISQIFSLLFTVFSGSIPEVELGYLILMVIGGILGGKVGSKICQRLSVKYVNWLFEFLMLVIIGINIYNIYKFS